MSHLGKIQPTGIFCKRKVKNLGRGVLSVRRENTIYIHMCEHLLKPAEIFCSVTVLVDLCLNIIHECILECQYTLN